jgi:hypothetical protein
MIMKPEDYFRKLKPVMGIAIDRLWTSYLAEDEKGKKEIEELLPILAQKALNKDYNNGYNLLVPPSKELASGEYIIGDVEYADKKFYPFGLREDEWIQHLSIFGRTGSGKTNLVYQLLRNFIQKGKPFLVFDWKRSYRKLAEENPGIKIYSIGQKACQFGFNPLVPPPNTNPEVWLKKLIEVMCHAYFLGDGVTYLLTQTFDALYKKYGVYWGVRKYDPTMKDAYQAIRYMNYKGRQSLWLASTIRAVYALCFGEFGKVLSNNPATPINDILMGQVIIELDSLSNADKIFFIEALLLWIYFYRMADGKRNEFKHAIVIEEAHHILLKKKLDVTGEEPVTDIIIREIREFGESIIVVDQHPSLISPAAIGNTYCTVCLNLKHKNDLDLMYKTLLLEERDILSRLPVGYGIVKLQGRYFMPFLIKIPRS